MVRAWTGGPSTVRSDHKISSPVLLANYGILRIASPCARFLASIAGPARRIRMDEGTISIGRTHIRLPEPVTPTGWTRPVINTVKAPPRTRRLAVDLEGLRAARALVLGLLAEIERERPG